MTITALKCRLLKNSFLLSLKKRNPKNFDEILVRANKYTNDEEAWARHRESPNVKPQEDRKNGENMNEG